MEQDIFATIWEDFIPLSLPHATADEAIEHAKSLHQRAGDKLRRIRAVHLPPGATALVILWESAHAPH